MTVQVSSVEEISREVVSHLMKDAPNRNRRYVIGLAGIPGSGKSTLAYAVRDRVTELWLQARSILNSPWNQVNYPVCVVGVDGWHCTRAELEKFPDPAYAFRKRGAPWTFDDSSYAVFVEHLLRQEGMSDMPFPTFDHTTKDPNPRGGTIKAFPEHPIIIIEGLYSLLGPSAKGAWHFATDILDERWFLHIEQELATQRLIKRHLESGICETPNEAVYRVKDNDIPNGEFLLKHSRLPTLVYMTNPELNYEEE